MPGIFGFKISQNNDHCFINKMADAMNTSSEFQHEATFKTCNVAASRVHLGHIGYSNLTEPDQNVTIWIEGESYNLESIWEEMEFEGEINLDSALTQAYNRSLLDKLLSKLDGFFCAALYDHQKEIISLISDRYGMRFLYWYFREGEFIWSSEVKPILQLKNIEKSIDKNSLNCFMDLGYLLDEHTWFEHIKLVRPATIIEFDINQNSCTQRNYWKWSDIKPRDMSFDQAVNELGDKFIEAVKIRFENNEGNVGIALSGGLDSRAIFAAVEKIDPNYKGFAYTFGTPQCDDITIAEQVISKSNWKQKIYHFKDSKWFQFRIGKVWDTDGLQDIMHMHGSEFLSDISTNIKVNLNGYSGDVILGGGFLPKVPLNQRASKENIKSFFGNYTHLIDIDNDFYDIDKVEPILQMNRVRRFTAMGTVNSLIAVEQRKPFFDNEIVELIYSLPDEYRVNNKLYSAMLQRTFPKYFRDIPWQQTGKPAAEVQPISLFLRIKNKLVRICSQLLGVKSDKEYVNYNKWLRSPDVMSYLEKLLSDENAIYRRFTDVDFYTTYLLPHKKKLGIDNSQKILRAATIEIYLRMVHKAELPSAHDNIEEI